MRTPLTSNLLSILGAPSLSLPAFPLARGIYNRLAPDGRFSGKQISSEVQWRLNSIVSGGGNSASQLVFRPKPADLVGWDGEDEDMLFARDTP